MYCPTCESQTTVTSIRFPYHCIFVSAPAYQPCKASAPLVQCGLPGPSFILPALLPSFLLSCLPASLPAACDFGCLADRSVPLHHCLQLWSRGGREQGAAGVQEGGHGTLAAAHGVLQHRPGTLSTSGWCTVKTLIPPCLGRVAAGF